MSDPYAVLGVPPTASRAEIKAAFKKRALQCHPDVHATAPESVKLRVHAEFQALQDAYQLLLDGAPHTRQRLRTACVTLTAPTSPSRCGAADSRRGLGSSRGSSSRQQHGYPRRGAYYSETGAYHQHYSGQRQHSNGEWPGGEGSLHRVRCLWARCTSRQATRARARAHT